MKTLIGFCGAFAAATVLADAPVVSDVTFSQVRLTREVTITYKLDQPAVITIGIQTNGGDGAWIDLPPSAHSHFTGACNRLVTETGTDQVVHWHPEKAWPGHRITTESARAVVTAWATNAPPDYMAVDLNDGSKRFYAYAEAVPQGVGNDRYRSSEMLFRRIPAAGVTWRIGAPAAEVGNKFKDAWPHLVELSADYYMAIYPTTTRQMTILTGNSTYTYGTGNEDSDYCPAMCMSWNDLRGSDTWPTADATHPVASSSLLGQHIRPKMKIADLDLPTDAQWEYACRAGTASALNNGKELTEMEGTNNPALDEIAWYAGNSSQGYGTQRVHHVGLKQPNAWGMYDMIGNSLEWVLDWYEDWYQKNFVAGQVYRDPAGPSTGSSRALRGGGYESLARACRSAYRALWTPTTRKNAGFRLVCPITNVLAQ